MTLFVDGAGVVGADVGGGAVGVGVAVGVVAVAVAVAVAVVARRVQSRPDPVFCPMLVGSVANVRLFPC